MTLDADVFHTQSQATATSSSSLPRTRPRTSAISSATYKGRRDLALAAQPTDQLDLYASFGYTDSRITAMADPTVIGNQAPLRLAEYGQCRRAVSSSPWAMACNGTVRLDYNEIGRTWWEPYNITSRDPVSLVDLRMGLQAQELDRHRVVKEFDQQDLQCRIFAGQRRRRRLPVARLAAALRRRSRLQILIRRKSMASKSKLPSRLHHTAYVTRDLEATRKFYEDLIGLPLIGDLVRSG